MNRLWPQTPTTPKYHSNDIIPTTTTSISANATSLTITTARRNQKGHRIGGVVWSFLVSYGGVYSAARASQSKHLGKYRHIKRDIHIIIYDGAVVRPGGVSGYPRAWRRSVSWVRIPPSAYSYKFVGTLSCAQIDLRKARERESAILDEKSTSSGIAEPYAR